MQYKLNYNIDPTSGYLISLSGIDKPIPVHVEDPQGGSFVAAARRFLTEYLSV